MQNNIVNIFQTILSQNIQPDQIACMCFMGLANLGLNPKFTEKIISIGLGNKLRKRIETLPTENGIPDIPKIVRLLELEGSIWANLSPFFNLLDSPISEIQNLGLIWMNIFVACEEEKNEMQQVDGFSKILMFSWGKKNNLNLKLARMCLEKVVEKPKIPPSLVDLCKFRILEEESITWEEVMRLPEDLKEKSPALAILKKRTSQGTLHV